MLAHDRGAGELGPDPGDPPLAPVFELVVIGLQAPAGHQRSQVRTRVTVVAWALDAQVEGLGLVRDPVPVVSPAVELGGSVAGEPVDAGPRCAVEQLHVAAGLLDHDLAPYVDARLPRPALVD